MTERIEAALRRDGASWRDDIANHDIVYRAETSSQPRQRWLLPAAAAATVVAILAAVLIIKQGTADQRSPAAANRSPTAGAASRDPLRPSLPAYAQKLPAPQPVHLLTSEEARGLISMPWTLTDITPTGLDVLFVAGGGCVTPAGFELTETDRAVTLAALSRDNGATNCSSDRIHQRGIIKLTTPLDGRTLFHAPVSAGWTSP